MAKWYGNIGYGVTVETEPGIWEQTIIERPYYGELTRNTKKQSQSSDRINDDLTLSNGISIIADPFACQNFSDIRYVEIMGTKWKITEVEIQYPRLLLTTGGVYNNG